MPELEPGSISVNRGEAPRYAVRPILLKKSISADDGKILARIRREARVDVGDHKQ